MTARAFDGHTTQLTIDLKKEKLSDVLFGYQFELGLLGHDITKSPKPRQLHSVSHCRNCGREMRMYESLGLGQATVFADFGPDTQCVGKQISLHGGEP